MILFFNKKLLKHLYFMTVHRNAGEDLQVCAFHLEGGSHDLVLAEHNTAPWLPIVRMIYCKPMSSRVWIECRIRHIEAEGSRKFFPGGTSSLSRGFV